MNYNNQEVAVFVRQFCEANAQAHVLKSTENTLRSWSEKEDFGRIPAQTYFQKAQISNWCD